MRWQQTLAPTDGRALGVAEQEPQTFEMTLIYAFVSRDGIIKSNSQLAQEAIAGDRMRDDAAAIRWVLDVVGGLYNKDGTVKG